MFHNDFVGCGEFWLIFGGPGVFRMFHWVFIGFIFFLIFKISLSILFFLETIQVF